jgi:hypothetical protein
VFVASGIQHATRTCLILSYVALPLSGVPRNFCRWGSFNKFSWGHRAERTGIWGRQPHSHRFCSICKWVNPVFLLVCYGCIFHGTGNSAQLCQNFGISGVGGEPHKKNPLDTPLLPLFIFKLSHKRRDFRKQTLCYVDRASWIIRIHVITNSTHSLSLVYWITTPLHVSGVSAAHHQETEYAYIYICVCVCGKWYLLYRMRQWIRRFTTLFFSGSATLERIPLSSFCCQL